LYTFLLFQVDCVIFICVLNFVFFFKVSKRQLDLVVVITKCLAQLLSLSILDIHGEITISDINVRINQPSKIMSNWILSLDKIDFSDDLFLHILSLHLLLACTGEKMDEAQHYQRSMCTNRIKVYRPDAVIERCWSHYR
jgi:hypothetical protein